MQLITNPNVRFSSATYEHQNNTDEQTVIEVLTNKEKRTYSFNMTNIAQTTTIRVYEHDGTSYVLKDPKTYPTDFATGQKSVEIELVGKNNNQKITFESDIVEGSAKNVPYKVRLSSI